jgi:gliding motility-associated-like protein
MKAIILLGGILISLIGTGGDRLYAQKENNIWAFGPHLKFTFSSGAPAVSSSALEVWEGCATIADSSGALLFYSDGNRVWDRTESVMPNGADLLGNQITSATQGVAIVPSLYSNDQYYLFVLDARESKDAGYLYYSLIDMKLNSGKGDIVPGRKNVLLDSLLGEKMTVTGGTDCSLWLLVHERDSAIYHAFKIDHDGLHLSPVVSSAGIKPGNGNYITGEMKVSPDRTRVITGIKHEDESYLELSDFNNATGQVSNARCLDSNFMASYIYGLEFSPDNSKLYVGDMGLGLSQYDFSFFPDIAQIRNSKTIISQDRAKGMRMGPDHKIYVAQNGTVGRIDHPDLPGTACNFNPDIGVAIGNFCTGFGNAVLYPKQVSVDLGPDRIICAGESVTFNIQQPGAVYLWQDGSTGPSYTTGVPGTVWVSASNGSCADSDTVIVRQYGCEQCLMVPNAFSPNNDGKNDYFRIETICVPQTFELRIFNRWGEPVFQSSDVKETWDGTYKNMPCDIGTYMYQVELKSQKGQVFKDRGDLVLLR